MRRRASHSERTALVDLAARLITQDRLTPRDAVTKAIGEVMPPRKQMGYSEAILAWKWLKTEVDQKVAALLLQNPTHPRSAPAPEPEPFDIKTLTTDEMLQELSRRLVGIIQGVIATAVGDALKSKVVLTTDQPQTEVTIQKVEKKPRMPRIGIASLLPRQEQIIRAEFGADIDLRIVKSNMIDSHQSARAMTNCDVVILMANFIGHQKETSIRKVNANCVIVRGGMTELRDKLTELYIKATEGA